MSEVATVLDYAGPKTHGRARLPSRSVLTYERSIDGGLQVTEILSGKANAIGAILFAAFSLTGVLAVSFATGAPLILLMLPILFAAGGVGVMLAVINNTWRRTILKVTGDGIDLWFTSPLRMPRLMQWPFERIHTVMAVRTADESVSSEVAGGELDIVIADGPLVRLFPGHSHHEMAWIADCIRAIRGDANMVEYVDAANDRPSTKDGRGH